MGRHALHFSNPAGDGNRWMKARQKMDVILGPADRARRTSQFQALGYDRLMHANLDPIGDKRLATMGAPNRVNEEFQPISGSRHVPLISPAGASASEGGFALF